MTLRSPPLPHPLDGSQYSYSYSANGRTLYYAGVGIWETLFYELDGN